MEKISQVSSNGEDESATNSLTTVWADGCYDIGHFGHANSLRQARALGDKLIVGIHSDAEILENKGPVVFTEEERYAMIEAIRWVDEIVKKAPYVTTLETLQKYNCDYCAHGDDITTTSDGQDTYQMVKDSGMYKEVGRTHGISTTDLVYRLLAASESENETKSETKDEELTENVISESEELKTSSYTGRAPFLLLTRKIKDFSQHVKTPQENSKITYVSGAFDVLHPGHLAFLSEASKLGDYLIVGLHSDSLVKSYKGSNQPIMKLEERYLSLLACRYVDDVLLNAPYTVSSDMIQHLNISTVAHGKIPASLDPISQKDPHEVPKKLNIFREIDSGNSLTTEILIKRVGSRRHEFEARNVKKEMKEIEIESRLKKEENNNDNN